MTRNLLLAIAIAGVVASMDVRLVAQPAVVAQLVRGLIQGQLPDRTSVPWEGVHILIESGARPGGVRETYTDVRGMFEFTNVAAGNYVLTAEIPDRVRKRYAVTVRATASYDIPPIVLGSMKDYISAFRDGVKAVDSRNWNAAAVSMREVLQMQPRGGAPVKQVRIYGMRIEPYAPNYYLGVALVELRQCDRARNAFAGAEAEVRGTALASRLAELRQRC